MFSGRVVLWLLFVIMSVLGISQCYKVASMFMHWNMCVEEIMGLSRDMFLILSLGFLIFFMGDFIVFCWSRCMLCV